MDALCMSWVYGIKNWNTTILINSKKKLVVDLFYFKSNQAPNLTENSQKQKIYIYIY